VSGAELAYPPAMTGRRGVLLLNLGTPASPRPRAVRRYLREFLGDPRVIDLPTPLRWLLLYGAILPFRPRNTAAAYEKIWGPEGSPLLMHSLALRDGLAKELGAGYVVELGMRYGEPPVVAALERLAARVEGILVLPLFPQYSASATGSALEAVYRAAGARPNPPALEVLPYFYDAPGFVDCLAEIARELPLEDRPDHLLISFHGLPERQIRKSDPSEHHCLAHPGCCEAPDCPITTCYRAQCRSTARRLAGALELREEHWTLAFQSRLGTTPWLRPYTDEVLPDLAERGVRRLAVACPSFVADCLETLEEIGLRAREQWRELGGEELILIPSLNAHPRWVRTVADWLRRGIPRRAPDPGAT